MIDRLLDLSQNQLLVPVLLILGVAWLVKAMFGLQQWRGQNRREFLQNWIQADTRDDIWLEVMFRHLTGHYLPAPIIRAVERVPGKIEALMELGHVWPYLKLDAGQPVTWRHPGHATVGKRRARRWGYNLGYFATAYVALWLGLLVAPVPLTQPMAWMLWVIALVAASVALRCLALSDNLKEADKLAPRWLEFLNQTPPPNPTALPRKSRYVPLRRPS